MLQLFHLNTEMVIKVFWLWS